VCAAVCVCVLYLGLQFHQYQVGGAGAPFGERPAAQDLPHEAVGEQRSARQEQVLVSALAALLRAA